LYSSTVLSTAEQAYFKRLCKVFIGLFRSDPSLKRVLSVKMHLLEVHAAQQLTHFGGSLATFLEEGIERDHHVFNQLNARYCNVTNTEKRFELIMQSIGERTSPR